ncbi:MAG TPA: hypothetical protein VFA60_08365 [Terriglobales bacterium]|nr:hypothetical protein [Terriglobales bacterium]
MNKQYLVVKVAKDLKSAALEFMPFAGLFTREAAEQALRALNETDPEGMFLIQEVGVA